MGGFKLGGMTFGSLFKKPETTKYPFEEKEAYPGLKGTIVLSEPENCILCGICDKTCPCNSIKVDKAARTWSIDVMGCIQCGMCWRACPKNCLAMDPKRPAVSTKKEITVVTVPEKEKPAKAEGEDGKELTKEEKIAKALAAKKAREEAKAKEEAAAAADVAPAEGTPAANEKPASEE